MKIPTFLNGYKCNVYSQNGEDGIIQEILNRLGIVSGFLCEFGAADGFWLSNTANLWTENYDFKAILIESDKEQYNKLVINTEKYNNVMPVWATITPEEGHRDSLDVILKGLHIDNDKLQLLSIDIDGEDYFVWKNLQNFTPKVLLIEVNRQLGSSKYISSTNGTSYVSMCELADMKGYKLAAFTGNCIFVRKDLYHLLGD